MDRLEPLAEKDLAEVGQFVRDHRIMWRLTQTELAQRAGLTLSTVFHIERGDRVRPQSIARVCAGLGTSVDAILKRRVVIRSPEIPQVVHRAERTFWYSPIDHRRSVPADNSLRIADPMERQRLGALGLVPVFAGYPGFAMPQGPGVARIELYGRYESSFSEAIYREAVLYCQSGGVRLQIEGTLHELSTGDSIGFANGGLQWLEPTGTLPAKEPTLLFWTGAVRIGTVLRPGQTRTAVRRPKTPPIP